MRRVEELLPPSAAGDEALVRTLVELVNSAYAVGESDLWIDGTVRTDEAEIAGLIRGGEMLVGTVDGRVVGCARLRTLDPSTAELGFISAAPDAWGSGVGRRVVHAAEHLARSRGATTMRLELLVPRDGVHPVKERLRAWYERLGYEVVRRAPVEEIAAHVAPVLATPCEFLVFRKSLGAA